MRARHLLDRSSPLFGAETTKAVYEAFDRAWAAVSAAYTGDAAAVDKARLKLAECVLAVTRDGATDADQIRRLALQMFQMRSSGGVDGS
jgi:hypothetical protein